MKKGGRRKHGNKSYIKSKKKEKKTAINHVVDQTPPQIKEKEEELQSTMLQKRLILITRRQLQILFTMGDNFRKRKNASIKKSIRW